MNAIRHWRRHTDRLKAILQQDRLGLITDIDGTISSIAPTPDTAVVQPTCRRALQQLTERIPLVAAVSGRAAEDARRIVDVADLVYVGNHGLDRLTPEGLTILPEAQRYAQAIHQLLAQADQAVDLPGILTENKGSTASIHYRQCPDPEHARRAILAALQPTAEQVGLRLTEGRQVIEIRPPLAQDKGTAVRALIDDYGLQGVFYLGDDTTDADAFEALHTWQAGHEVQTESALALAVISSETPEVVKETADLHLQGIEDVVAFLDWLVEHVPQTD